MLGAVPPLMVPTAHGRVGRLEARVVLPRGDVGAEPLQLADQGRGGGDGVDADLGHARMRLAAGDARAVGVDALMRVDHPHAGRLADDDGAGPRQVRAKPGDQRAHAGAAHLLVIGDDDVDRLFQLARLEQRHRGEHAGEKALHVASAAAIELAVALRQRERVGASSAGLRPARNRCGPRARCRLRWSRRWWRTDRPWCRRGRGRASRRCRGP